MTPFQLAYFGSNSAAQQQRVRGQPCALYADSVNRTTSDRQVGQRESSTTADKQVGQHKTAAAHLQLSFKRLAQLQLAAARDRQNRQRRQADLDKTATLHGSNSCCGGLCT
jgi:hypothetical protein